MIARLSGRLARKSPEALIVDVHGVGVAEALALGATLRMLPLRKITGRPHFNFRMRRRN